MTRFIKKTRAATSSDPPIKVSAQPIDELETRWGNSLEFRNLQKAVADSEKLNIEDDFEHIKNEFSKRKIATLLQRASIDAVSACGAYDSALRSRFAGRMVIYEKHARQIDICLRRLQTAVQTLEYSWLDKAFKTQQAKKAVIDSIVDEALSRHSELEIIIDALKTLITDIDQTVKTLKIINDGLLMEFRQEKTYGR